MKLICSNCLKEYDNGIFCKECNDELIQIDELLYPIILDLNKKGYKTLSCCSGHNDGHPKNKTYIKFKNGYEPDSIPNGFIMIKDENNNTIICRYYPKHVDIRQLEGLIFKSILDLFNWALTL